MQIKQNALASILIPVHSETLYLHETIDSILSQTHSNFNVVFVEDRLQDRSRKWLHKLVEANTNFFIIDSIKPGISAALNFGLQECRSKYIIRIDADDLMEKTRVQKQIEFMEENPGISVLGSQIELFNDEGIMGMSNYPTKNEEIIGQMSYLNAIAHPSVILRRETIINLGFYDPYYDGIEDFELWQRLIQKGAQFENLPEPLTRYRIHQKQSTRNHHLRNQQLKKILKLEGILGHDKRIEQQNLEEYIEFLMLKLNEKNKNLSNNFKTQDILENLFEGGFEGLSKHPIKKMQTLLKLIIAKPIFAYRLILKFGKKYIQSRIYKGSIKLLSIRFFKSQFLKIMQSLKYQLYKQVIRIISSKYFYYLPSISLRIIQRNISRKIGSIRILEDKTILGFAFHDGQDWIHIWRSGALIYNEFKSNAFAIVNADTELFTQEYKPKKGDVILDIGAGVGTSTLIFSQMVGKNGKVIAFEPDSDSHRRITKLVKLLKIKNTEIHQVGVYDETTFLTLYKDGDVGSANSIFRKDFAVTQQIAVTTLQEFLEKHGIKQVNYLKMNIEGSEHHALRGLGSFINKVDHFVIACHDFVDVEEMKTLNKVINLLTENELNPKRHSISENQPWSSYYVYASKKD